MRSRGLRRTLTESFLLLSTAGLFVACEHDTATAPLPPAGLQATLSSIQANIFTPKCATVGCHVVGGLAPMSLASGDSYLSLIGAAGTGVPSANPNYSGKLRAAPGNANVSVLYLKVIGDNSVGGVGGRMPPSGALSQAETDSIAAWINAGAQNN